MTAPKKPLLCFAHPGEAFAFLKHFDYEKRETVESVLYETDENFLTIVGEGDYLSISCLSFILAKYGKSISFLVNLGLAASLDSKYEVKKSYSIRTIYHHNGRDLEFKSFTCEGYDKNYCDCMSVNKRILRSADLEEAKIVTPVVDREAWPMSFVAKRFSFPFYCRKTISDSPSEGTNCELIKDQSKYWSTIILEDFLRQGFLNANMRPTGENIFARQDFYFTRSLKDKLNSLAAKTKIETSLIEHLSKLQVSPKKRTSILIQKLEKQIKPISSKIKDDLKTMFSLQKAELKFDPFLESPKVTFKGEITNQIDLERLKEDLARLDTQKLKDYFEGKNDVL